MFYSGSDNKVEDLGVEDSRSMSVFTEGKCYVAMLKRPHDLKPPEGDADARPHGRLVRGGGRELVPVSMGSEPGQGGLQSRGVGGVSR